MTHQPTYSKTTMYQAKHMKLTWCSSMVAETRMYEKRGVIAMSFTETLTNILYCL